MTISVQVRNEDTTRVVEVEELHFERGGSGAKSFPREVTQLQPGEARTFYVHLLKELRISERTP